MLAAFPNFRKGAARHLLNGARPTYIDNLATRRGPSREGTDMLRNQTTLELTCKNGHHSEHLLDRVLRHDDAWCPKCGADIKYTADPELSALPKAA